LIQRGRNRTNSEIVLFRSILFVRRKGVQAGSLRYGRLEICATRLAWFVRGLGILIRFYTVLYGFRLAYVQYIKVAAGCGEGALAGEKVGK